MSCCQEGKNLFSLQIYFYWTNYNFQIYQLYQFKTYKDAYHSIQSYMLCHLSTHNHLCYVSVKQQGSIEWSSFIEGCRLFRGRLMVWLLHALNTVGIYSSGCGFEVWNLHHATILFSALQSYRLQFTFQPCHAAGVLLIFLILLATLSFMLLCRAHFFLSFFMNW